MTRAESYAQGFVCVPMSHGKGRMLISNMSLCMTDVPLRKAVVTVIVGDCAFVKFLLQIADAELNGT